MEYKDYYKTLGVDRKASQDEIHKAYRKLARKFHPDVNKDKGAEDKFKAVGEAYEVLKDPGKRKKYDTLGANWKQGQGFRPPPGWEGGFRTQPGGGRQHQQQEFSGFSDFFDAFFGGGGFGGFTSTGGQGGPGGFAGFGGQQGQRPGGRPGMKGFDHEAHMDLTLEEALAGGSHRVSLQHTPQGGAQPPTQKTLDVKIPPYVKDGMKIRVPKQGGAGVAGGQPGDLFLTVRLKPHPYFKPDEHDLRMALPVSPWEAMRGATVTVPTLDGKVKVTIKPGARSGQKLRLANQGLPKKGGGRGDLFAEIQIQIPAKPSKHEKEMMELLANRSAFNPREWEK
ncbi:DnaJ domain-containing protein [bacterium]|nr:DnaJ domain-containing protein [bacterium]